jgi:DivIVA domain-containing protein
MAPRLPDPAASSVYDLLMDELSPLFQEIEFHERYRGYDPDEVDAFVDRVARAAAVMRGRISELHERAEAAEARSAGAVAASDTEETLTRTLVLAQRTADAAIAEAREEANRLTADAATSAQAILSAAEAEAQLSLREAHAEATATLKDAVDRAGLILAEAETDRRAVVAEAAALAADAASAERERLAVEVAELHEYRAFLADDVEILERHLAEERHRLTASLSALTDLLESPEAFRAARPPATSGVEIDDDLTTTVLAPEEVVVEEVAPETVVEEVAVEEVAVEEVAPETVAEEVVAEEVVAEEVLAEEAAPAPVVVHPAIEPQDDDGHTIDLVAAEAGREPAEAADRDDDVVYTEIRLDEPETGAESSPVEPDLPGRAEPAFAGMGESTLAEAPAPHRLVTAADLETSSASRGRFGFETSTVDRFLADGGPATEAMPIVTEGSLFAEPETADDPFLAQLRDAVAAEPMPERDEEALSAFFDQEDDDGARSWFGRRR